MFFCISFCIAIIGSRFQSALLPSNFLYPLLFLALSLLFFNYAHRYLLITLLSGFLAGLVYVNWVSSERLQQQLPQAFEQKDITIEGVISSLPVKKGRYWQFSVDIDTAHLESTGQPLSLKKLVLNDYQLNKTLHACDQWHFSVRLKKPHGLGNPAGFDYEAYLLEQNVQGKGYVRKAQLINVNESFCLHRTRQSWSDYVVKKIPTESAAWIVALSTGDKSLLNDDQQLLLRETGVTHLFVISGAHIGLSALAIYAFIMLLRRIGIGYLLKGDWRPFAAVMAIITATAYTALAGYGVPAVRALVMLIVFMGSQVIGVQVSLWLRYWLSMTVVLLINPLSALNIGFALSFGAVFVLVLLAESQQYTVLYAKKYQRVLHALKQLLWAQVVIFIGLLPFMLLYFSQVSLLAPAINFIAIPVMGFVILPTILLALVFWCISDNDYGLLVLAEYELQLLFEFIAATNQFFKAFFTTFPTLAFNQSMIMVLALASLLLLLPKVFKVWPLGILLLCMVFFSKPHTGLNNNKLLMRVFDVDQGLSIFIQTENHNVLIDTGSAWPKGSMVNSAIKPYLLLQGIKDMDKVIISHLDNDHSGGIYDVLDAFNVKEVISSEPIENINAHICKTGDQWQWDDVIFTVMHPDNVDNYWKRNNKSCVLLIKVAGRSILLPGDAEALVEREIGHELPNIDVMIAPHHGSKTSSTLSWVQKVKNGIVIFSSGYLSQFKHPHPLIEQRYKAVNAKAFTTALEGMITVEIAGDGHISTYGWRETEGKYWQKNHRINNHSD